ncbi:MAG: hypothetical protein E7005_05730 [Alphaproteobacteria bacterium]|nr:hypothetical protein [Alphaproteobacteria bacterium]
MIKINNILAVIIFSMVFSMPAKAQVNKNNLDQNADQTQGNYAATNLNYLGGVGSLGMMQSAWKDPLQHMGEGQLKPGYSKYYWTSDLVLPVRVREGMYTLINFPSWEVIENVYLGDGQSFVAQIQGPSSLMVYPDSSQFVGVDTNMIVFGRSGNKYVFYVQSETVNTDRITNAIIDIEVVNKNKNSKYAGANGSGGVYGGGNSGMSGSDAGVDSTYTRDLQKEDWIEKIPVDPTQFRFDIEVYVPNPDDIIIAPERVWRDNIFTYIDLGEKALTAIQRPIVTLIVERSETPVGFRAAGPNNRLIIVEGMGDMVLRSGKRMVCLKLRRADSDGLENTVYAKTNEWDLQSSYASKPENVENIEDSEQIEDVYGQENVNKDKSSFFDFSSFFSDSDNDEQNVNQKGQASLNLSANVDVNGVPAGVTTTPNALNIPVKNDALNANININSIPKVVPQTMPVDVNVNVDNKSIPSSNDIKLEGEYDINIDGSKIVVPEYNKDAKVNGGVNVNINTKENGGQLGNSNNNSNPVLISSENTNVKSEKISTKTNKIIEEFKNSLAYDNRNDSSISIELGTDENVNNLEKLWNEISKRYSATIGKYQPFYSVDTPADGQGKEVFHLRVGPINSLEDGDDICSQLGRNGIFCSVVRIQ